MECVDGDCNCGNGCQNQRFQRKQYADVSVIKTEKKGFGLRANTDLQPNDFVFEYIGEVINEPTFRRRMLQYDDEGIKHFYFMSLTKHEFVDATKKGNLGRFCNHSCNPNCYVDKWVVGEKLRMGIFAGRAIRAGEELVFNYNVDRYGAEPQPCYCGEPNCTGFIGGKTQTERATKLPPATIEALGIDDGDNWDTAVAKRPRKKKSGEDDEEYVNSVQPRGLDEDGVTKVMAALLQCKEKWIAVKLLARIQQSQDERVLHRVVRMHGYQILKTTLNAFIDDYNVVLQILDILYRFPRLTKNKISDSKIENSIEALATSEHEDVAAESKRLLDEWSKLETAYRIPRKKLDPAAPQPQANNSFEQRRGGQGRDEEPATAAAAANTANNNNNNNKPASPFSNVVIPKGPRSNIPQRNANYFNAQRPRRPPGAPNHHGGPGLPAGWYTATDNRGQTYYYNKSGVTTWQRPTAPADKTATPKGPSKAQQDKNAVQEIINSLTRETPRPSASHTPQGSSTPAQDPKKEKWRSLPIEKQMKIYENTVCSSFSLSFPFFFPLFRLWGRGPSFLLVLPSPLPSPLPFHPYPLALYSAGSVRGRVAAANASVLLAAIQTREVCHGQVQAQVAQRRTEEVREGGQQEAGRLGLQEQSRRGSKLHLDQTGEEGEVARQGLLRPRCGKVSAAREEEGRTGGAACGDGERGRQGGCLVVQARCGSGLAPRQG